MPGGAAITAVHGSQSTDGHTLLPATISSAGAIRGSPVPQSNHDQVLQPASTNSLPDSAALTAVPAPAAQPALDQANSPPDTAALTAVPAPAAQPAFDQANSPPDTAALTAVPVAQPAVDHTLQHASANSAPDGAALTAEPVANPTLAVHVIPCLPPSSTALE